MISIEIAPHPLLDAVAFATRYPVPLGELAAPAITATAITSPFSPVDDSVRAEVRALLRHGGYKPSGRGKPASEYLAEKGMPAINHAVDACNVVSMMSGLPISVVDRDLLDGDLAIAICPPGTTYAFNPSGQTIDASGLVALCDRVGPSGTPVKDAQRTKTSPATRNTVSVIWGTTALPGRAATAARWYRHLLLSIPGVVVD
jgi:DNA/RNA-binding domain of Phe-tRNA-synthetase-like protein